MQSNKGLIFLVAGLGALIVLGLVAVVAGIVIKSSGSGASLFGSAPTGAEIQVTLPAGAKVIDVSADDGVLHVYMEADGSASVWRIDAASGRVLGKLHLVAPSPQK
ncbi:MAG: hypothetical protein HOO19_04100 [Rhodospirillaceae bacterium]|jgi:hypothetical protein|nr:hypothetical protein [Rhodospirillaceae bacterium]MBT4116260.1 hypothetical protein [Rhodospirillaceae bacterium]MBT4673924.1 hypothetical protein [Rhodospirillaceae bacterium]MBT4719968.1 hypothetical protein [Rhodospirillaceae bacterium]MBT4748488.1 hypothetical protein [Rhodospirillaceae bacterium]